MGMMTFSARCSEREGRDVACADSFGEDVANSRFFMGPHAADCPTAVPAAGLTRSLDAVAAGCARLRWGQLRS